MINTAPCRVVTPRSREPFGHFTTAKYQPLIPFFIGSIIIPGIFQSKPAAGRIISRSKGVFIVSADWLARIRLAQSDPTIALIGKTPFAHNTWKNKHPLTAPVPLLPRSTLSVKIR